MTPGDDTAGFGAVVLAAGPSLRLGRPKQLLPWHGEPLVRRAARIALDAGFWPVVVVLGACCDEVRAVLAGMPVATIANPAFGEGVAGSMRAGLRRLRVCAPEATGALFLACDQPLVEPAHLGALAGAALRSGKPVVASSSAGSPGLPALLAAPTFAEVLALEGDVGVGALIARDAARVVPVALAAAAVDVDTPEDWERLCAGDGSEQIAAGAPARTRRT